MHFGILNSTKKEKRIFQDHSFNLYIYPNPSTGIFNIEGMDAKAKVSIFNAFGTEVSSQNLLLPDRVDLTGQPNGVYLIKIQTNDKTWFEKVIKN
ncbi:MAG: T9SS type A sorting domain-containing protein [Bacteroidales bacterium]|nr:T9SS type A sorting domain-containing protein [Bacteroidales bacterium]